MIVWIVRKDHSCLVYPIFKKKVLPTSGLSRIPFHRDRKEYTEIPGSSYEESQEGSLNCV